MKIQSRCMACLLTVCCLTACDPSDDGQQKSINSGNYSVTANEGRLVGRGGMEVDGHKIQVKMSRVTVDGVDYGMASDGAEIYFRSNGDYQQLLVNGEPRTPSSKK